MNSFQTLCQGCFSPVPFGAAPDPRFTAAQEIKTGASSSYDALQATGQKQISHGLTVQLNYTYSHCLDTGSNGGFFSFSAASLNSGSFLLSPVNVKRYYGNCDYDVRHSLNGSYVYEL